MKYLKVVGYKSTVAELTTFAAILQDKCQRNMDTCNAGISISMHPIPQMPVVNKTKTFSAKIVTSEFEIRSNLKV